MLAALARAKTLAPVLARLTQLQKRVEDEVFRSKNESWQTARELYGVLQLRSRVNGEVARNLEPIAEFFARRPNKSKTKTQPAAAATTSTTSLITHAPNAVTNGASSTNGAAVTNGFAVHA